MYLFFDTETNGVPTDGRASIMNLDNWPRLIQLAYIVFDKAGNEMQKGDFYIRPTNFQIPSDVSRLNGITNEYAIRNGKELQYVLNSFQSIVTNAEFIVAHNVQFDEKILGAEFLRCKMKNVLAAKRKICTMEKTTDFCAISNGVGYKWPKLSELHYKLFSTHYAETHNAVNDVAITAKCFWELRKRNKI